MNIYNVKLFGREGNVYYAESSDLGLAPGVVPNNIEIAHPGGDTENFRFSHYGFDDDGDIISFKYKNNQNEILEVYND